MSETIAQLLPGSAGMGINTPVLFIAAGICCFYFSERAKPPGFVMLCCALLLILPSLILAEHIFSISLGIDFVRIPTLPSAATPHPGRVAPNTCVGFLLAGLAFILSRRISQFKWARRAMTALALAVFMIGFSALIGHFLNLQMMYQIASFNRMMAPTAFGMTILGLGLLFLLQGVTVRQQISSELQEKKITRTAAIVLTLMAVVAGIVGFGVLRAGFDEVIAQNMLLTTGSSANAIENSMRQRYLLAETIALRPDLQRSLITLDATPTNKPVLELIREIGDGLAPIGVSGIRFYSASGKLLTMTGRMTRENAAAAVNVGLLPDGRAALLWRDGYYLYTDIDVIKNGERIGRLEIEQQLDFIAMLMKDIRSKGESNDIVLCGRQADDALCFASRFYPLNTRIPLNKKDRTSNLAIGHALLGSRGVAGFKDLRGIDVLAGYTPVGNLDLGIVVKVDTHELYAPLRARLNSLIGLLIGLVGIGTYVLRSQVQPLAAWLSTEQRRMKVILDSSHEAFVAINGAGKITDWNANAVTTFGWSREEAIGQSMAQLIIPPEFRDGHQRGWERHLSSGVPTVMDKRMELTAMRQSGEQFPVEITISKIDSDSMVGFTAFMHDISDRRKSEQALRESQDRLRMIADNMPALIAYIDKEERYRFSNRTYQLWYGRSPSQAGDCTVREFLGEDGYQQVQPSIRRALGGQKITFDKSYPDGTGAIRYTQISYLPDIGEGGVVNGIYVMVLDMTEQKTLEMRLHAQAMRDPLTRLPNRTEFCSRLIQAIERVNRLNTDLAVMFLDVDGFKNINDTLGHHVGDALLQALGARLQACVRKSDTVARWAGDEFILIIENPTTATPGFESVAQKILQAMQQPMSFGHVNRLITVSIGIAIFDNGNESAEDLIIRADKAMYLAKNNGKNQYFFAPASKEGMAV